MKLSDYIYALQGIFKAEGDLEVQDYSAWADRRSASLPEVAYALILKGRESKPRFWNTYDGEERKGEKVVRI